MLATLLGRNASGSSKRRVGGVIIKIGGDTETRNLYWRFVFWGRCSCARFEKNCDGSAEAEAGFDVDKTIAE